MSETSQEPAHEVLIRELRALNKSLLSSLQDIVNKPIEGRQIAQLAIKRHAEFNHWKPK